MSEKIIGWQGCCFVPGEGHRDDQGRALIMTTHQEAAKPTPEEAWSDAVDLGRKHQSEWIAIQPVTEDRPVTARRLVTYAIYETRAENP